MSNDPRVIDIYDQYDALELGHARAYLDLELKHTEKKKVWKPGPLRSFSFGTDW